MSAAPLLLLGGHPWSLALQGPLFHSVKWEDALIVAAAMALTVVFSVP